MDEYDGKQYVGIDLRRRRSVIVRMTPEGERIGPMVRIDSEPFELGYPMEARLAPQRLPQRRQQKLARLGQAAADHDDLDVVECLSDKQTVGEGVDRLIPYPCRSGVGRQDPVIAAAVLVAPVASR